MPTLCAVTTTRLSASPKTASSKEIVVPEKYYNKHSYIAATCTFELRANCANTEISCGWQNTLHTPRHCEVLCCALHLFDRSTSATSAPRHLCRCRRYSTSCLFSERHMVVASSGIAYYISASHSACHMGNVCSGACITGQYTSLPVLQLSINGYDVTEICIDILIKCIITFRKNYTRNKTIMVSIKQLRSL